MKIIDEKARLFGKINVIDFFALLFLISLLPMFYFGYKIFTKKPEKILEPNKFIEVEINAKFIKVEPKVLRLISEKDKEVDEKGMVIGEIISLGEPKPYEYKFDLRGEEVNKIDPILKGIPAKLRVMAKAIDDGLYYKNKRIIINSPIDFKTGEYSVQAIVTATQMAEVIGELRAEVAVILKNLDESTLKLISVGDKELNEKNEVIAEILSIGKIEPDSREISLGSGSYTTIYPSGRKQVNVKMRLKCLIDDAGQLYFKNNRITGNSSLEFKTDKYTVFGKIATLYEPASFPLKRQWIQAVIKFSGVISEVAKLVYEGDKETNAEGQIVARLKKIVSNKSSEVLVLKEDKWITLDHPFQKDIVVILDILCVEKEGVFYFKNYPIKIGNTIVFSPEMYSISGTVIGLEIK